MKRKHKTNYEETKSTGDSSKFLSKIVNSKKTLRHSEGKREKKKAISSGELSETLIEKVVKRIGRSSIHSLADRALEAMKRISRSPFASWIIR